MLDGVFHVRDETIFSIDNRGFKYGDAVFETVRIVNGKPCFLSAHMDRLRKGLDVLRMVYEPTFFDLLEQQILSLLQKNNIGKGARIRITVYRTGEGLYEPSDESKSYVIEAIPLEHNFYCMNEHGLNVGVYDHLRRVGSSISAIKTTNNIPYVLAALHKKENKFDDCLVLNEQGRIAEAISSNVFIVSQEKLYTPPINEGCVEGIMRKQVIDIAKKMEIEVFQEAISLEAIEAADELFLTNVVQGIRWVASCGNTLFQKQLSEAILNQLNKNV